MAGTGSETTVAAVITDSKTRRKASINDPCLIPRYAVLDPELTAGTPPFLTGATGMDALCHAVEAYTNHMYNTKLENLFCINAVRLIYDNLYKVYIDGSDMTARENMQGRSDAEKAENFISWIEDMNRKMDIPEKLDMIKDKDVDQIIRWAMKEANPLYPTPVLWGYDELKTFIDSVRE